MSWGAVAGATIGLIGGKMQADSAEDAGQIQSDAAIQASNNSLTAGREAMGLTADMYKSGLAQNAPYQQGGQVALSALMNGLGLGPASSSVVPPAVQANNNGNQGVLPGTGSATSVGQFVNAAGQAVDAQGNPIMTSGAQDFGIGGINYGATQGEMDAGANSIESGYFNKQFTPEDLAAGLDPGYQFRIDQGNAALGAKRAAVGNRFGGQALKDITNYNQDAASQEYGKAYDRFTQNKSLLFDRLSGIAGVGQKTGADAAAAGTGAANTMSDSLLKSTSSSNDYLTGGAASRAAGEVGSTNAIVGGLNNGLNNWYTGNILNKYNPNNPQQPTQYAGNMTGFYGGNGTSGD